MEVYVYTQGAHISLRDNLFIVEKDKDTTKQFPLHMVESISVFGNVQLTT